jgi:hypothetical protein
MTQREFERRVKGVVEQPHGRSRRERSQPGRFGGLLKATLAMLCVVALLGLTAAGNSYFSLKRGASQQTVQLTEEQAVAQASAAAAATVPVAQHALHTAHLQRVASRAHRSSRHTGATGARRSASAALGSAGNHGASSERSIGSSAAGSSPDAGAATITGTVMSLRSGIRSALAPIFGSDAANSGADIFALNLPTLAAAGAFILVLLLCLGAGTVLSQKANRAQRGVEA